MALMEDPVTAADGASYERSAIEMWFELGEQQGAHGLPFLALGGGPPPITGRAWKLLLHACPKAPPGLDLW